MTKYIITLFVLLGSVFGLYQVIKGEWDINSKEKQDKKPTTKMNEVKRSEPNPDTEIETVIHRDGIGEDPTPEQKRDYEFKLGTYEFQLTFNDAVLSIKKNKEWQKILRIPSEFWDVSFFKAFLIDSYLYIFAQITIHTETESTALMIDLERSQVIWQIRNHGFVEDVLITRDYLYFGGFGSVYKINRLTGEKLWAHEGFYDYKEYHYAAFRKPEIIDGKVIFEERFEYTEEPYEDLKVIVDNNTGEIISPKNLEMD